MAEERKMKACVFGVGAMGLPAAWAMQKLGFELQLIEEEEDLFDGIEALLGVKPQWPKYNGSKDIDKDCDVLISCVSWMLTESVAADCAELGIPYCDLGGNPETSCSIQEKFRKTIPVFTDLGLAPGLVNIIAEHAYAQDPDTKEVLMRCGGLPCDIPDNRLKYARTFHSGGLTNEYSGMCDVIEGGEHKKVPALSGVENPPNCGVGFDEPIWEHFHTKGGSNGSILSMLDRGIQELSYKTIRYAGHVDYIKFLTEDCKIKEKELGRALQNACPRTKEDRVIMEVETDNGSIDLEIIYDDQWTAMAKGTAFPTAAVAAIMTKHKDPKVWFYADVPMDEFRDNLKIICGEELQF